MNQIISKIYPKTKNSRYAVDSVYLRKRLIFKKNHDKPMYYANFLTSLDGRIATYNDKYKQLFKKKFRAGENGLFLTQNSLIQASALEESKTKARLDELELFTPCTFFSYTLALCPFVCLFVPVLLPKRAALPANKTLVLFFVPKQRMVQA